MHRPPRAQTAPLYARVPVTLRSADAPPAGDGAVDAAWYAWRYPDIAAAGLDPARHYAEAGWREGRRPTPWFDPAWYLQTYPDIAAAGLEPFAHYRAHGRAEGRLPARPDDDSRQVLEAALATHPPQSPAADAAEDSSLSLEATRALLGTIATAAGLVLAASHTAYIAVTGGIELVIADEQRLFAAAGVAYLHLAPASPALALRADGAHPARLAVALDGVPRGTVRTDTLREALAAEAVRLPARRLFVVHSFLGHRANDLISLAAALGASRRLLWLHDYAVLCEGFTLLRNDLAFCHAPPPQSMACAVCTHGAGRAEHLRRVRQLLAGLRPTLVAPSASALERVRGNDQLPPLPAIVHPNATLRAGPTTAHDRLLLGSAADPVRVAFAGYPMAHKGWPAFLRLLRALQDNGAYRLFQFAAPEALVPLRGLTGIAVRTTAAARDAMTQALAAAGIDLLLALSPWPETFSFVAHEAIAAGADVITLADSGHIARLVRHLGRGAVFADEAALHAFFTSGAALDYVRDAAAEGRQTAELVLNGTSATLPPAIGLPAAAAD